MCVLCPRGGFIIAVIVSLIVLLFGVTTKTVNGLFFPPSLISLFLSRSSPEVEGVALMLHCRWWYIYTSHFAFCIIKNYHVSKTILALAHLGLSCLKNNMKHISSTSSSAVCLGSGLIHKALQETLKYDSHNNKYAIMINIKELYCSLLTGYFNKLHVYKKACHHCHGICKHTNTHNTRPKAFLMTLQWLR